MLIPIEYRLQCDNGAKCRTTVVGDRQVILANTKTEARRKAESAGWVRRKLGTYGPMVDLCPDCAASEVSS